MRTLFGARDNTVSCLSGAGKEREQTVFTPESVLQVPRMLWETIEYDPCHGKPGHVLTKAGRRVVKDHAAYGTPPLPTTTVERVCAGLAVRVSSQVLAQRHTDSRGLIDTWPHCTFCNPPYGDLSRWLDMSLRQISDHIMLIPVRPNRKWWREWARQAEVVYLNPVKFEGHDQCFPAPLCLARRNAPKPGQFAAICAMLGLGETI